LHERARFGEITARGRVMQQQNIAFLRDRREALAECMNAFIKKKGGL
jgi:hypothetical protein